MRLLATLGVWLPLVLATSSLDEHNSGIFATPQKLRRYAAPSCGIIGDKPGPFRTRSTKCRLYNCRDLCVATEGCESYGIGNSQCLLFSTDVATDFVSDSSSTYTYYDVDCSETTTSTAIATASETDHPTTSSTVVETSSDTATELTTITTTSETTSDTTTELTPTTTAEDTTTETIEPTATTSEATTESTPTTTTEATPTEISTTDTTAELTPTTTAESATTEPTEPATTNSEPSTELSSTSDSTTELASTTLATSVTEATTAAPDTTTEVSTTSDAPGTTEATSSAPNEPTPTLYRLRLETTDGSTFGYVSNDIPYPGYTLYGGQSGAVQVSFSSTPGAQSVSQVDLVHSDPNVALSGLTRFGAVAGSGNTSPSFASDLVNYAYISATASTPPGSPSVANIDQALKRYASYSGAVQSAIWSIDLDTLQVSPVWINADGSSYSATIFWNASVGFLGIAGSLTKFQQTFPNESITALKLVLEAVI